jgi:hypothetical protein
MTRMAPSMDYLRAYQIYTAQPLLWGFLRALRPLLIIHDPLHLLRFLTQIRQALIHFAHFVLKKIFVFEFSLLNYLGLLGGSMSPTFMMIFYFLLILVFQILIFFFQILYVFFLILYVFFQILFSFISLLLLLSSQPLHSRCIHHS